MKLTESKLTSISMFKVTSADTDMYARLRLSAAINLLVQSAIDSADSLGFGYQGIRHQNLYWVLSRLTIELHRPIKWYEKVEVETWPKNVERVLYLRDYLIRDANRNVVGKATSGWLAVDIETKRMKKIDGVHADYFSHLKDKHAIVALPEKLYPVSDGESFEIRSCYFDIDLNGHVSTTRYIDWMMNTLSRDFHKDNYPKKLSINIMKETMPEEMILIKRNNNNEMQYQFEGFKMNDNVNVFRAAIDF